MRGRLVSWPGLPAAARRLPGARQPAATRRLGRRVVLAVIGV